MGISIIELLGNIKEKKLGDEKLSEQLVNKIDLAIEKLVDDIIGDKVTDSSLADTVKALTGLITIRIQLY